MLKDITGKKKKVKGDDCKNRHSVADIIYVQCQ